MTNVAPITLLDGLSTTRAIRRYTEQAVTDDELATVMFGATRAPSGSNRQPFRFVVVRDGETAADAKRLIARAGRMLWAGKRGSDGYDEGGGSDPSSPKARMAATMDAYVARLAEVPVLVFGCLVRYRDPVLTEGASIYPACQNLLLAARALGLGGVLTTMHTFVEDDLRSLLRIPAEPAVTIAATITLGHPVGRHGPVRRRPLATLVFDGGWEEPADWAVDPSATRFTSTGPAHAG